MLFNFRVDRQDAVKTGRFLLHFVFVYIAFSGIFSFVVPLQKMEGLVAAATLSFLKAIGYNGSIVVQEPVLISLDNGVSIVISGLCTGLMELFIVVSAILASTGIEWRKRIIGAAAAAAVLQLFNFARIFSTILVILNTSSLEAIEFTHNILFRVFLFIVIAGSYIVWFYYSTRK